MKGSAGAPSLSHIRNSSFPGIISVQYFTPISCCNKEMCCILYQKKKEKLNVMSFNCEDDPPVPVHCFVALGSERAQVCAQELEATGEWLGCHTGGSVDGEAWRRTQGRKLVRLRGKIIAFLVPARSLLVLPVVTTLLAASVLLTSLREGASTD